MSLIDQSGVAIRAGNIKECRYGENPHQRGQLHIEADFVEPCVATAIQVSGKEMSFNNYYDADAALETVKEFVDTPAPYDQPAGVIVKHTNPCGVALAPTLRQAILWARLGDPTSAFGGILAVNRPIDIETAAAIAERGSFFEVIVAPEYEIRAQEMLQNRAGWGADIRLLEVGDLEDWRAKARTVSYKPVVGGLLVQDRDLEVVTSRDLQTVTDRAPTDEEIVELLFAWRVVKHVKSNAIVLTKDLQVIGVGAGQMNRVRSVRLAVEQAGETAKEAVMASDAFFPFPDGPETAIANGITAIIQPGGSKKDQETIDVCNKYGIAMVYTGVRHFLH